MSNVAGKAYAMNVLTPMRPSRTWVNTLIFMAARALPDQLAGLLGLSIIHFARWFMVRRRDWADLGQGQEHLQNDYMIFCSNFNGTWDQYIDAFSDGLPNGLDLFWYSSTKYPKSIPITRSKTTFAPTRTKRAEQSRLPRLRTSREQRYGQCGPQPAALCQGALGYARKLTCRISTAAIIFCPP